VRTVEHYFHPYGGYSPNPLVFLSAAAAVTRSIRLVTGAVLPVFNNPLKLAGEIGMVDAISGGRLEAGFARAFLPHEFARFGFPWRKAARASRKGSSKSVACLRRSMSPPKANFFFQGCDVAAPPDSETAAAVLDRGIVHR